MTAWRLPSGTEREVDRRILARFLQPSIAAAIAALPVVVVDLEPFAPFALRADAWCHRVDRLIGGDIPSREVAA
jgi:hypothetical protein